MRQPPIIKQTGVIEESVRGIVDRVTYHNSDNGFSILRVFPFNNPHQQETVVVHQTKVFAGATNEALIPYETELVIPKKFQHVKFG